jgi:putative transposase
VHLMKVIRSAYHGWLKRESTALEKADEGLIVQLRSAFEQSRATYGTRRLKQVLENQGQVVSRQRIGCLMPAANLSCKTKRKFRVTTDSKHKLPIAHNNLERQFTVQQPNQVYVGNITYLHTQEGWLYLAVVMTCTHGKSSVGRWLLI